MHSHIHSHVHKPISSKKIWYMTLITFIFCIIEAISGYLSNSLALIADAAHNFTDVFALSLSAAAISVAKKSADNKLTFGYHRVGILAAFINALTLIGLSIGIFYISISRLKNDDIPQSNIMILIALLGLILNTYVGIVLHTDAKKDLNIKSAYLHMLGDAAASLAVVIGGIIILFTNNYIIDPIISIIFSFLIIWSCIDVLKQSIYTLLESVPNHLDLNIIKENLNNIQGVINVHDVHIWTISQGLVACCCHVKVYDQSISQAQEIIDNIKYTLQHTFNINHVTVQLEIIDCVQHYHMPYL